MGEGRSPTSSSDILLSVCCPAGVPAAPCFCDLPPVLLSPLKAATSLPDLITGFEIAPKNLLEGEGDGVAFGSPVIWPKFGLDREPCSAKVDSEPVESNRPSSTTGG